MIPSSRSSLLVQTLVRPHGKTAPNSHTFDRCPFVFHFFSFVPRKVSPEKWTSIFLLPPPGGWKTRGLDPAALKEAYNASKYQSALFLDINGNRMHQVGYRTLGVYFIIHTHITTHDHIVLFRPLLELVTERFGSCKVNERTSRHIVQTEASKDP